MPDLRLAFPAAALWIVCAVVIGEPESVGVVVVATALGAGAIVVCVLLGVRRVRSIRRDAALVRGSWRSGRLAHWAPAVATILAAASLGSAAVAAQAPGRVSAELASAAESARVTELLVRVDRAPQRTVAGFGGEPRWSLRGQALTVGGSVPVSVLFGATEREARVFSLGSVARLRGQVLRNEPGEPTTYTVRATDPASVVERPPPWLAWAGTVRLTFAEAAALTPGDGGMLLPGLAIGDETAVSPELDEAMNASSLSHLTAVSGANCALVIGLVFALARLVGAGRRTRVLVAAAALVAFVVLVGPGASVIRAAVMAGVLLTGLARGRPADGLPALALAVIVLVVHDPWLARDYGFALSVLATAGLLVLAAPLSRMLGRWMPRSLAIALAVPTAAQLACQPVLLLLTPTMPLYGIPANLLAEPAAPVATVLGCIACVLLPWLPGAGQFAVWLAWAPSAWIAQVALFVSSLPGAGLPWAPGLLGVLLSGCVLIAVGVLLLARRAPRAVTVTAAIALCVGTVVYVSALGGAVAGRMLAIPGDWQIAACDVGQGDGILVRDGDMVAMIDVGREAGPATACLDRLGIGRLDLLVLTHFDADHVGGIAAVADRTERAIVQRPARAADERTLAALQDAGVPVERGHAGLSGRLGDLTWRLLWPPGAPPAPGAPGAPGGSSAPGGAAATDTGNAGSLTVEVEGRGVRSLFLGDLDEEAQDALLATRTVRPVDVVKVAHHGSADQSAPLYRALGAKVGLVSVGVKNGYGHPTQTALRILAETGTAIARTDEQGMALVSPAESGVRLWTERPAPAADGGRLYPGYDGIRHHGSWSERPRGGRGGTWRLEAAEPVQQRRAPPRVRSRRCRGTRCERLRSSSSPDRKGFSRIGRSACCATPSKRTIPASRSVTSMRATTLRVSSSRLRAPPSSASRA